MCVLKSTSTHPTTARTPRQGATHWAPHTMLALVSGASLALWLLAGTAGRLLLG
jgi:hypothetical protein